MQRNFFSIFWLSIIMVQSIFGAVQNKEHEVVFRQIGHRLLLSSGDSTSRVLPIETISANLYAINFENPLHVNADSLYKIVEYELARVGIKNYVTELKGCKSEDVYLSFMISPANDSITPCGGRAIPRGCYTLEITLLKEKSKLWLIMVILPFVFIPFYLLNRKKNETNPKTSQDTIPIGAYAFDEKRRELIYQNQKESLTEKESKLLSVLHQQQNETINRDFLMNEIWAESGVLVVSKNLDVLVSKLRKKLVQDDRIKITNVHGVGYKLEIE